MVYRTEPTFKTSRQFFDYDLLLIVGTYLLTYLVDLI